MLPDSSLFPLSWEAREAKEITTKSLSCLLFFFSLLLNRQVGWQRLRLRPFHKVLLLFFFIIIIMIMCDLYDLFSVVPSFHKISSYYMRGHFVFSGRLVVVCVSLQRSLPTNFLSISYFWRVKSSPCRVPSFSLSTTSFFQTSIYWFRCGSERRVYGWHLVTLFYFLQIWIISTDWLL